MSSSGQEQVTIFVHGTFANLGYAASTGDALADGAETPWWRLTANSDTTADRLKDALNAIDPALAATVWAPGADPRDGDLGYRDLGEWSGANSHRARLRAARHLARSLTTLADRRGCTAANPLHVNVVAHSHGGNVTLAALKRLGPNVKARQVCMLGTPLTWRFLDPRILYLPILLLVVYAFFTGLVMDTDRSEAGTLLVIFVPLVLWTAFVALSVCRWVFSFLPGSPAYGPWPRRLEKILGGRAAVLFLCAEDEADLMLQVGAAPLDAYRAMVRGRPGFDGFRSLTGKCLCLLLRIAEVLYVRPLAYVVFIPLVEITLERFGLGFPLIGLSSPFFINFEMVTWTGARAYKTAPKSIVTHRVPASALKPRVVAMSLTTRLIPVGQKTGRMTGTAHDAERIQVLRHTLLETFKGLRDQIKLRHSGYYESQDIIDQVAVAIAEA